MSCLAHWTTSARNTNFLTPRIHVVRMNPLTDGFGCCGDSGPSQCPVLAIEFQNIQMVPRNKVFVVFIHMCLWIFLSKNFLSSKLLTHRETTTLGLILIDAASTSQSRGDLQHPTYSCSIGDYGKSMKIMLHYDVSNRFPCFMFLLFALNHWAVNTCHILPQCFSH